MIAVKSQDMKRIDTYMIDTMGMHSLALMENASKSVVDEVVKLQGLKKTSPIHVVCGTGNNGGDGFCVARWLIHYNYNVSISIIGSKARLSNDAKNEYDLLLKIIEVKGKGSLIWINDSIKTEEEIEGNIDCVTKLLSKASLIIDGMIGTGCSRVVSDIHTKLIEAINDSEARVVAIDMPTGINSNDGKVMGLAVQADLTVTFCLPKIGALLYPGNEYVGKLIIKDIGIIKEAYSEATEAIKIISRETIDDYVNQGMFKRKPNSHKGSFGTVGIIAGDSTMLGASLMAAKAAYKSGAGLVKVFINEDSASGFLSTCPEAVIVTYDASSSRESLDQALSKFMDEVSVIVIGPGLSKSVHARHLMRGVLGHVGKVVIDADGLNIISENMEWFEERNCECLITPHIGEMARLTGYCSTGILENPLQIGQAFADKYQVMTVLKSARTFIAGPGQQGKINLSGNSGLATGGSGDVLAGVIGGLIAQGYSLDQAATIGVLLHGISGDYYSKENGEHSLIASDIIDCLWKGIKIEGLKGEWSNEVYF